MYKFLLVLALSVSGFLFYKLNEKQKNIETLEKTVSQVLMQAQGAPQNSISKSFLDVGVKDCIAKINQITNFVGTGGETGAFLFIPPKDINNNLLSASMEIVGADGNFAYVSSSFAPNQENGCSGIYDAVSVWKMSCEEVAQNIFANYKITGQLKKNISILEIDKTTRVFLMPANNACVSIKKEVSL